MPAELEVSPVSDFQNSRKELTMITTSNEVQEVQEVEVPTEAVPEEISTLSSDVFAGVTEMKLSDLVREGSQLFPQEYGWGDGVNTGCALTAGYVAAQKAGY